MTEKTVETLRSIRLRVAYWPDWAYEATEGLSFESLVETETKKNKFFNDIYLVSVKPM